MKGEMRGGARRMFKPHGERKGHERGKWEKFIESVPGPFAAHPGNGRINSSRRLDKEAAKGKCG